MFVNIKHIGKFLLRAKRSQTCRDSHTQAFKLRYYNYVALLFPKMYFNIVFIAICKKNIFIYILSIVLQHDSLAVFLQLTVILSYKGGKKF